MIDLPGLLCHLANGVRAVADHENGGDTMNPKFKVRMPGFYLTSILVAMLFLTGVAIASPIAYSVNRTIAAGSVTGTIQTDGTIGVLGAANVVDWNLTLNDGTNTFILTGPASGNNSHVFITGSDVSATATNLLFNFSGVDSGYFLFQVSFGSGLHYYCNATSAGVCLAGESAVPNTLSTIQNASRSGNTIIGAAAGPPPIVNTVIPTLSDWSLITLSMLLFGTAFWMRSKPRARAIRGPGRAGRRVTDRRTSD
jgi:IPTL-CTERM motif